MVTAILSHWVLERFVTQQRLTDRAPRLRPKPHHALVKPALLSLASCGNTSSSSKQNTYRADPKPDGRSKYKDQNISAGLCLSGEAQSRAANVSPSLPPPRPPQHSTQSLGHREPTTHAPSSLAQGVRESPAWAGVHTPAGTGDKRKIALTFPSKEQQGATHRGHRQVAVPAEKGVRDGHTDALSGTAVLGDEGHFSLLDTVGDRGEGRSSIGGLLDRRDEREDREGGRKAENGQAGT